jgi:hypothetical protein
LSPRSLASAPLRPRAHRSMRVAGLRERSYLREMRGLMIFAAALVNVRYKAPL